MSDYSDNLFQKSLPGNFGHAKKLRRNQTPEEEILWKELRNKKLLGYKFRRQHPVGVYIADFYCHELSLVIELDGNYHREEGQKIYDATRDFTMKLGDLKVLRFKNSEVRKDLEGVLGKIKNEMLKIKKAKENVK